MKQTHKEFVHRLGNLTLLIGKVNKQIRDKSFKQKKVLSYKKSGLKINEELMHYAEWEHKEIVKRQERLAKDALDIWKI